MRPKVTGQAECADILRNGAVAPDAVIKNDVGLFLGRVEIPREETFARIHAGEVRVREPETDGSDTMNFEKSQSLRER